MAAAMLRTALDMLATCCKVALFVAFAYLATIGAKIALAPYGGLVMDAAMGVMGAWSLAALVLGAPAAAGAILLTLLRRRDDGR